MKGKLKLIILSMLALFLIACGNATPSGGGTGGDTLKPDGDTGGETLKPDGDTGGETLKPGGDTGDGTTPKEPVVIVNWEKIDDEIENTKFDAKFIKELPGSEVEVVDYIESGNYHHIEENLKVVYNTELFKVDGKDIGDTHLFIPNEAHLEFESNVGEIKFLSIENTGNMYFVEKVTKPKEYSTISGQFINKGNIYVMDGNYGRTLKIDGYYSSGLLSGDIYLGLYVSDNKTNFSTDKVHITEDVSNTTKVNFVCDVYQVKGLDKNATYYGEEKDNFVIKVDGNVYEGEKAFEMAPFPLGLNVLEFKYYEKKGATDSHLWKLERVE